MPMLRIVIWLDLIHSTSPSIYYMPCKERFDINLYIRGAGEKSVDKRYKYTHNEEYTFEKGEKLSYQV